MVIGYLFHPMNKRIDIDTIIYTAMYEKLAKEFHTVFFNNATNTYADGMQAAQVLANVHETVVNNLVSDINNKGKHVTTGIVSNAQIYSVLSDNGHHDLVHVSYTRDERHTISNLIRLRIIIPVNARAHVMFEPLFGPLTILLWINNDSISNKT